ncbi:MAG: glycosyltransferase family 4 protein, partial [Thermoplasmata archaeon]
EVLTDESLRKELSKKGLKRAKLFSWRKTAEETWKVYEEVYYGK